MNTRPPAPRRRLPVVLAVVGILALAGCSSSGGSTAGSAHAGADAGGGAAMAPEPAQQGALDSLAAGRSFGAAGGSTSDSAQPAKASRPDTLIEPAIISTGVVSLRSRDVGAIGFDVQTILAEHQGTVDDERTQTDDQGTVVRSKLVIRVPSAEFSDTMDALEKVGTLQSSSRQSEDVTTQVIDNAVRIRAQEESLRRIEALLARATNIRTIISIEAQLSQRQADLDSLKSTQAYLKDQTSMSTITVLMERTPEPVRTKKTQHEAAGFLTGLEDGWGALTALAAGLALLLGRLLPFLVVLAILAYPALLLLRRLRPGRRPVAEPVAAAE
jgi:hypothetical protein